MTPIRLNVFLVTFFFFLFSGCTKTVVPAPAEPLEFLELYLSRASLSSTEFEQYKISPGGIFIECGEVKGGRPLAASQQFKRYDSTAFSEIEAQAFDLLSYLETHESTFDPPGKLGSLADPGQFNLSISFGKKRKEIKTSVNAVSEPHNGGTTKVKKLTQIIRKTVQNDVCGKASFYGIETSS